MCYLDRVRKRKGTILSKKSTLALFLVLPVILMGMYFSYLLLYLFFGTIMILIAGRLNITLAFAASIVVLGVPLTSDTLNYYNIYNGWYNLSSTQGIESGYILANEIYNSIDVDFSFFLLSCQFMITGVLIYACNVMKVRSRLLLLIVALTLVSPAFVLNTTLLLRSFIAVSFFLLAIIFSERRFLTTSLASLSMLFHIYTFSLLPVLSRRFNLFIFKKWVIVTVLLLSIGQLIGGVFADILYSSLLGVSFGSEQLARKLMLINEINSNITFSMLIKPYLVLASILALDYREIVNLTRIRLSLLSLFVISSSYSLILPYGEIFITRLGLLPYYLISIYCVFYISSFNMDTVRIKLISSLMVLYVMVMTIYSFIYNDFLNVSNRVLSEGYYMISGLTYYFLSL